VPPPRSEPIGNEPAEVLLEADQAASRRIRTSRRNSVGASPTCGNQSPRLSSRLEANSYIFARHDLTGPRICGLSPYLESQFHLTQLLTPSLCIGPVLWHYRLAPPVPPAKKLSGRRLYSVPVVAQPTQNSAHRFETANASCPLRCPEGSCGLRCPAPEHPAVG
jgi:hypothetical protein